jgi:hypothetical protein
MTSQQKVLANTLAGIIDRLDEARSSALQTRDLDDVGFEGGDLDSDMSDDADRMEAAVLQYENKMYDLTQVLGEELDNLRGLLEALEEDM